MGLTRAGVAGAILAAICCATPLLVVSLWRALARGSPIRA